MSNFLDVCNTNHQQLSQVVNKYRELFSGSKASLGIIPSQSGGVCDIASNQPIELKNKLGTVEIYVAYSNDNENVKNIEYSFKYKSDIEHTQLHVSGKGLTKRRFGFRYERDEARSGWGHPSMHLQMEMAEKPRFKQNFIDEFEALSEFLKTIQETYCNHESFEMGTLTVSRR